MLYAVCLAGIPGRIINGVMDDLRRKYTASHVFRGAGAPLNSNQSETVYSPKIVDDALRSAVDAVFGKSARPYGFCRNTGFPCAIKNSPKHSCNKNEEQSCSLKKPDYLILLIQSGRNEEILTKRFHYAAFTAKISQDAYNKKEKTVSEIVGALKAAEPLVGQIRKVNSSMNSPLLLPPLNFDSKELYKVLKRVMQGDLDKACSEFRNEYFVKSKKSYKGRSNLHFSPAGLSGRHGILGSSAEEDLSISANFRLGCGYPRDFHYDVKNQNGTNLNGTIKFNCRRKGEIAPTGTHVNLTVDDCVI